MIPREGEFSKATNKKQFGVLFTMRSALRVYGSGACGFAALSSSFIRRAHNDSAVGKPSRTPLTNLKDKVVLITGASAGIGVACAWRFAEHGSKLILVARRDSRLQELKSALLKEYPHLHIHTVALSVTDLPAVAALPRQLPSEFQEVDILVNNAGLARGVTTVDNNDVNDALEVIQTNVIGTIAFCSAFVPSMKARGRGHIVNMGSVAVSKELLQFEN
jgi:NADP-dependent 3-hydroxy acid dehydrogenase YdfG